LPWKRIQIPLTWQSVRANRRKESTLANGEWTAHRFVFHRGSSRISWIINTNTDVFVRYFRGYFQISYQKTFGRNDSKLSHLLNFWYQGIAVFPSGIYTCLNLLDNTNILYNNILKRSTWQKKIRYHSLKKGLSEKVMAQ